MTTSDNTGFDKGPIRKSGRYFSESEILKKIEEAKKKAISFRVEAEDWELKADELRNKPESIIVLRECRDKAKKLREQATFQETIRLKFLSEKLAVLRTNLLPGMGADNSVPKIGSDRFLLRGESTKKPL